jgi:hypothetical protein
MTTKYLDGVQVTEGKADNAPRLIGTIDFTEFTTPSSTYYKKLMNVLTRNAKQRSFYFTSTLNQSLSASTVIYMIDSAINDVISISQGANMGGVLSTQNICMETSERLPYIACHFDSIQLGFPIGATLPTSGKIKVYVVECF